MLKRAVTFTMESGIKGRARLSAASSWPQPRLPGDNIDSSEWLESLGVPQLLLQALS